MAHELTRAQRLEELTRAVRAHVFAVETFNKVPLGVDAAAEYEEAIVTLRRLKSFLPPEEPEEERMTPPKTLLVFLREDQTHRIAVYPTPEGMFEACLENDAGPLLTAEARSPQGAVSALDIEYARHQATLKKSETPNG